MFPIASSDYNHSKSPHCTFLSLFECCKIPVVCHIVDLIREKKIQKKTFLQFGFELHSATYNLTMSHMMEDKVKPIKSSSKFYSAMVKNPLKYIHP